MLAMQSSSEPIEMPFGFGLEWDQEIMC